VKVYGNQLQRITFYFRQHRMLSIALGHALVLGVLGVMLLGNAFGSHLFNASANAGCTSGGQVYTITGGDTLSTIAARYNTTWQRLASYNGIANPDAIGINQRLCIPGQGQSQMLASYDNTGAMAVRGQANTFPYGQCTWWADQRYHQLHGVYVPWMYNSNAWQWTARALDYHWIVSSQPTPGSIITLQPWVQGAYGLGHVAVVERVLPNGHVITSNMNWSGAFDQITQVEFAPGPGVTFISV
jgi:surface antigen